MLKDCVMAATIRKNIETAGAGDKFLVIAGSGHLDYGLGVPERVEQLLATSLPRHQTAAITVRPVEPGQQGGTEQTEPLLQVAGWGERSFPADYLYLYTEQEEESVKQEISEAYNQVAATASVPGDAELARRVMTRLGYSGQQIEVAGQDCYNYQVLYIGKFSFISSFWKFCKFIFTELHRLFENHYKSTVASSSPESLPSMFVFPHWVTVHHHPSSPAPVLTIRFPTSARC